MEASTTKLRSLLLTFLLLITTAIASPTLACDECRKPPKAPKPSHPPKAKAPAHPPKSRVPCPPVYGPPHGHPPAPAPPATQTCPVDTLKLGACVDLLGGLVHIGLGDPVVNQCCPLLEGLVELEAAVCLCTTIRLKLLNINLALPLALQLLLTCGKTPPPGFTCSI
ncbi:hypothetical protein CFC21_111588 [Triticum aestivum]|uniref:Bifunctional inhibitor/plant lipid transfer protein/seed storage helical domain-containing protein n=2 Tax=Triticum aestivum TaxID=4565 RepID=A0A9R1NF84_WHEAT|nr:hypothetical protein CFC21_111588 [Triticum aestivum]